MVFSEAGSFDLPALLLRADQALYRAKQNGRNCLEIAMPDAAPPRSAAQADRPRSAFERPTAA
jgi:hypothetical protein